MGLFRKGKTLIIAKFHRADLVIFVILMRGKPCLIAEEMWQIANCADLELTAPKMHCFMTSNTKHAYVNHIALRKAKIVCSFGLSECNRVKQLLLCIYKYNATFDLKTSNSGQYVFLCTVGNLISFQSIDSHLLMSESASEKDCFGSWLYTFCG